MSGHPAAEGTSDFGVHLYVQLKAIPGNLFFSPYSLSTALAMTYAGARGRTEEQMARTLCFRLAQERLHPAFATLETKLAAVLRQGQVDLIVANALWPQLGYPFLADYLALVEQHYGARISAVDYREPEAARRTINDWVEARTKNRIRGLIPPGILNPLTTLVLTNTVYFMGTWARQFDARHTASAPFWVTPERPLQVPLMEQTGRFRFAQAKGMQILELPYAGEDLSMFVFLPTHRGGLAALEETLTASSLDRWTAGLQESTIQVYLPRFEIECSFDLGKTLTTLGMVDAFSSDADFSGMVGTRSLFIAKVLHKAFVRVNEIGTEAATATAAIMARSPPPTFRADHPFLFLIRDNGTRAVLFLGRVVDPDTGVQPVEG